MYFLRLIQLTEVKSSCGEHLQQQIGCWEAAADFAHALLACVGVGAFWGKEHPEHHAKHR